MINGQQIVQFIQIIHLWKKTMNGGGGEKPSSEKKSTFEEDVVETTGRGLLTTTGWAVTVGETIGCVSGSTSSASRSKLALATKSSN